jgi:hypothetical protein
MFPSELATLRFTGILVIFSDVGKFFAWQRLSIFRDFISLWSCVELVWEFLSH